MLRTLLVLAAFVAFAAAGQSPHADYIKELVKLGAIDSRYSTNIIEDANHDVPGLAEKYGYTLEVHDVTTSDGYILQMHRIPHGRNRNNQPGDRPVIFLMHGLLSSSADWVLMGPGKGLAYILAEEGYDVWMGNARGNYYSRRHLRLRPDALLNTEFWEFSWDEIGNIDVPTMIDYALEHTNKPALHYIGHSQGTTSFFVFAAQNPAENAKIISMHALAPVAYMANNRNLLLNVIAPFSKNLERLAGMFGMGEFLANSNVMTWAGQALCMDEVVFQPMCSSIMFLLGGWNEDQHNATMLPVKLGHAPAGASVRQLAHYGQGIADGLFRRYDHGWYRNRRLYGSIRPPNYNLGSISAPVFLHYSDNDPLAHVNDVFRLWRELGRPVGLFRVPMAKFTHLDFVWGIDAKTLIYDRVINLINAVEANTFDATFLNTY